MADLEYQPIKKLNSLVFISISLYEKKAYQHGSNPQSGLSPFFFNSDSLVLPPRDLP